MWSRRTPVRLLASAAAVAGLALAATSAGQGGGERFVPVDPQVVVPPGGNATVGVRVARPPGAFVRRALVRARAPEGLRVRSMRTSPNDDLTVRIAARRGLPPGRRTVTLVYAGGVTVPVRVVTPPAPAGFALSIAPAVFEAPVGATREVRFRVTRLGAVSDPIGLTVDAAPGLAIGVAPTRPNQTVVRLRVRGELPGTRTIRIFAEADGIVRRATAVALVVERPLPAPVDLQLEAGEVKALPLSLRAGQSVALRAAVELGDVDLVATDAGGSPVATSAAAGPQEERVSLTGPGDFTLEVRAVASSRLRVEAVAP